MEEVGDDGSEEEGEDAVAEDALQSGWVGWVGWEGARGGGGG